MIIGSILSKFSQLELATADDKHYTLKNNFVSRLALNMIGLPHLGFRIRARFILKEIISTVKNDSEILDAGCGYGLYSLTLASKEYRPIDALDIDSGRIQSLDSLLNEQPEIGKSIKLHTGSIAALPFANRSFETIICSDVIEHIKDDQTATKELARVLKTGGRLILSVPYDSKHNLKIFKRFGHERPGYTAAGLKVVFEPLGLTIEKTYFYEYVLGTVLFDTFNKISSKPLLGLLFYPFYFLYLLDSWLKISEPNGIIVVAKKHPDIQG